MSNRSARRRNQRNQRNLRHQRRNNPRRPHDNRNPRPDTGNTGRSSPLPSRPAQEPVPEPAPVPETVVSNPSRPPSVADSAVSLFPNVQDDQTRGGNQSIRSNQVQQELAWNPTNPPLRPGTVVSDPTPSGITFHHPSLLQIRPPSSAHVNRMRGGTASNPDTPPTPYVDENGDVQGLSPFFQPQIQPPPQAQVQPNDDMSAITQNDRTAQSSLSAPIILTSAHLCTLTTVNQSDAESRPSHHGNQNTVPPAPPATASTADYHQPLDLPLKIVNYQGSEMTNSPVLLRPGDEAFWKYGNELMRSVTIVETTLPTILRRQPIYHIKCSNDQEHDVRHDELFISKSDALALDHDGFIRSTGSVLSASDHLDLHAIDGPHSPENAAVWASLNPEKFKLHNLKTHLKDFALPDDSIVSLVYAYDFLSGAITAASTTGIVRLPDISALSPDVSIRDILLPPPSYPRFATAKACYTNIASSLAILFKTPEFAATAPKTKLSLLAVRNQDGIDQLNHMLRSRIPTLGATDFRPYEVIMELTVTNHMKLINYITQAKDIDMQLSFSAHPIEDNTLYSRFLQQLMQTNCHSFVSQFFADLNKFLKRHGSKKRYREDSIETVSQHLLDAGAPSYLVTLDTLNASQDVNNPTAYKEKMAKRKNRSAFQRMKYANMSLTDDPSGPSDAAEHDDSSVASENDHGLTEDEMEQATTQASMFYSAVVNSDSFQGDKDRLFDDLVFKAMEQVKAFRSPCDVCDATNHTGATCPHRGKAFQSEWLQKRVAQKNLVDGDTPKVPIPQKSPPPRASFSKFKPQFKTMSLSNPDAIRSELDTIQEALEQDTPTDDDLRFASMNESTDTDGSFSDQQVHFH
eukprot:scaffold72643_cov58-Cyclotella_meneghiniana.AAC.1